jgi:superfamily II DNA or RNA helicase/diadenosine tetraphosphate (Ap4A) HIT family hydrolase/HKD family nuclease
VTDGACPFCLSNADRVFYRDSLVIGLWDRFPVTPGHALLIPIRHVATWFEASIEERMALMHAVDAARLAIESNFGADGYNIGINNGEAAGQTVMHLHVHVIPRRRGDILDPRGGVRHVIPEKGNYIRDAAPLAIDISDYTTSHRSLFTGGTDDPLLPQLKHHLALSLAADVAVAFTLRSGLQLIHPHLQDVLDRGGQLRIVTGDYLGATDPDALLRLLDLSGQVECRVFETEGAAGTSAFAGSFHPKAYLFRHKDGTGAAFVGSSNLSVTALTTGVEWNYRVLESRDRAGWNEIRQAFEGLFASLSTVALTPEWIERYRNRRPFGSATVAIDVAPDPVPEVPTPHVIQQEALAALEDIRTGGCRAGLVVLATGLGKTWLSAFDSQAFRRVLFIAHREEILGQALATYRAIRPHDSMGRYTGEEKLPTAAVLFASIQTLGRQAHLDRFTRDEFDYIVVDEFHHAEARTYRRLIDYFTPRFLVGLTATPERTDGADLLTLCAGNLVYRCDLTEGIRRELLCPFRYFGVPDTVDYRNIPWRNRKFDEDELTKAASTQARAANALDQYRRRGGRRTIAFCVSQRHADFMASYLRDQGISAVAVHAGRTSAPRAESLEALKGGTLSVLCAVDMFNEGVDVPELDTVMMLRPTESRIVWLQQFGRGLRRSGPSKKLTVIDYIGNHRSFTLKPQALFNLPPGDREVLNLLERLDAGTAELPPGCEVTYELEVKDIFRALLSRSDSAVELLKRRYQDFRDTLGVRPTAAEMFREGYNPRAMHTAFGSWLGFVKAQGGLIAEEDAAYQETQEFLTALETTEMSRSYMMLVLLALLNRNQFPGALSIASLAEEIGAIASRDPRIAEDLGEAGGDSVRLQEMLAVNPIEAWVGGRGTGGVNYFGFSEDILRTLVSLSPTAIPAAQELVRELVDWRLAEYFQRPGRTVTGEIALKVNHSEGRPILFPLPRDTHPELPDGWTDLRVDGEILSASFVKVAVNVAHRPGSDENVLPEVLHRWFGPDAGKPGTKHQVILRRDGAAWDLSPLGISGAGAVPYKAYRRAEIAPLFGLPYSERYWGQGFVRQGNHTFLFVTLDKTDQTEAFQYKDHFISPNEFQWQSQNRTSQASDSGRSIQAHKERGIAVHLFVRAKPKMADGRGAPFYYCGPVDFLSWNGDKPITVVWRLPKPMPGPLWEEMGVASPEGRTITQNGGDP